MAACIRPSPKIFGYHAGFWRFACNPTAVTKILQIQGTWRWASFRLSIIPQPYKIQPHNQRQIMRSLFHIFLVTASILTLKLVSALRDAEQSVSAQHPDEY